MNPTSLELEILHILWENGPLSVQDVLEERKKDDPVTTYGSVLALLTTMFNKGLLLRWREGKKHIYQTKVAQKHILTKVVGKIIRQSFGGSTSNLVLHLLDEQPLTEDDQQIIGDLLKRYHHGDSNK